MYRGIFDEIVNFMNVKVINFYYEGKEKKTDILMERICCLIFLDFVENFRRIVF